MEAPRLPSTSLLSRPGPPCTTAPCPSTAVWQVLPHRRERQSAVARGRGWQTRRSRAPLPRRRRSEDALLEEPPSLRRFRRIFSNPA